MPWMPHTMRSSASRSQRAAVARQGALVDLAIPRDALCPGALDLDVAARLGPDSRPQVAALQQLADRLGQRAHFAGLEEEPGFAVTDQFAMAADIGGDEHAALGHGFEGFKRRH